MLKKDYYENLCKINKKAFSMFEKYKRNSTVFIETGCHDGNTCVKAAVLGYGEIGLNCQNSNPKTLMYKKWIETYSSIEYQDVCKNVSGLIDKAFLLRLGTNFENTYKWKKVNQIFKKATLLEVDFWNMAIK